MAQVYQVIARKIAAMRNCNKNGNVEWFERHRDAIENIIREYMPSGSGFDAGTTFDVCDNVDHGKDKLVFSTSFHHMDGNGYYCGWSEHNVIVTPSLTHGFDLRITGKDRNGIKDYIADVFHDALSRACAEF